MVAADEVDVDDGGVLVALVDAEIWFDEFGFVEEVGGGRFSENGGGHFSGAEGLDVEDLGVGFGDDVFEAGRILASAVSVVKIMLH